MANLFKKVAGLNLKPFPNAKAAARNRIVGFCTEAPPVKIEKTINSITLLGRVGANPQRRGNEEHPVVTFSLATHNNYRYESGEWAQRTDWHRVIVFKPTLRDTVMEYLKKGQRALIQGKITYGEITDQEGSNKPSTSIIAEDIIFFREK